MATSKYIFTVSNGQLLVELNNVALEFEGERTKTYKNPTLELFKKNIKIFDFGTLVESLKIENFDTIDGVVPTDIENAFSLLLALLNTTVGIVSLNPANVLTTSNIKDSSGNSLTSTSNALDINIKSSGVLPLPTGASTETTLSAINNKLPTLVNGMQPTSLSGINFAFSTVNSSVAQLAASTTFTGVIENTKNQPSISLLMVSDQNMLVTVLQYIDLAGTKLVASTPFLVYANDKLSRSFPINGNYVNITVKNIGVSTTTTFQLDTAFGIIDASDGSSNIPVSQSQQFASGNITTQNLVANGVATANSAVEVLLNGASNLSIQTTGTYTGALSLQVTNDNSRWETVTGALIYNSITGLYSATITSASIGIFSFKTGAFYKARVTGLSAMTGTCTVTLRANNSSSISTLDSAIPVGTNSIGNIGTVATVSAVTAVTNAGTPTVPATAFFLNSAATTNGALISTGTSGLSAFYATNIGSTVAFVKLYNKATAPTVGSDSPEMTIPIPPAVAGVAGVANISMGFNTFRFPLGLGIAITGVYADTDTTAVALNQVKVKISRTI